MNVSLTQKDTHLAPGRDGFLFGKLGTVGLLKNPPSYANCDDCPADFDNNGTVGATDLLALLVNWGPCP